MDHLALKPGFPGYNQKDMASLDYAMDTSRLPVNAYTTIGTGINRWEYLFFNPQKNSVEPFRRIGENSQLAVSDEHRDACFATYKAQGQITGEIKSYNDH